LSLSYGVRPNESQAVKMRDSSKGVWGSVPPIPPCASACHTPGAESWRCGRHHAPEPLPRRTPTTPLESASGLGGNSASARSVGESSACRVEPQALPWWSSSVLLPLTGLAPTVPTTAGRRHAALPKAHNWLEPLLDTLRSIRTVDLSATCRPATT